MAAKTVEIEGTAQTALLLHRIGQRGADQTETMEAEAKRVQRAITGVPRDSGRLDKSVHGGAETLRRVWPEGYLIGSLVPYAPFVFRGTRYMDARPPKVPADVADGAGRAIAKDLEHTPR